MKYEYKTAKIRTYTKLKEDETKKTNKSYPYIKHQDILVFDTETTFDTFQNLKFGVFQIYSKGSLTFQGMFYDTKNISRIELKEIKNYNSDFLLMTKEYFIHKIFYKLVYEQKFLCMGFNLFFDLTRIANKFPIPRKGRSSIQLQLSPYKNLPDIEIDNKGNNLTFIRFKNSFHFYKKKNNEYFAGDFLELQNLACTLLDKKRISLAEACKLLDTKYKKTEGITHGKITKEYIDYCVMDVKATYSLYEKLIEQYEKYTIDKDICKVYSSASISKSALQQLGVTSFTEQHKNINTRELESWMNGYFGGRCELMYRNKPAKVTVLDFLSMYPTTAVLMNLWKFIIAEKIVRKDVTKKIIHLLKKIDLNYLVKQENWKHMTVLVKVLPEDDFLPVRTNFKEDSKIPNISLNYITSKKPQYYALPDIIASVLITKKIPKILEAIQYIPEGVQKSLKNTKILDVDIDPRKTDLFKTIIEKRQSIKNKLETASGSKKLYYDNYQRALKIFANSVSYGIYVEMNRIDSHKETFELENIYDETEITTDIYEKEGIYFNPIVAVTEIAGARLFLAMAQAFVEKEGYKHYYTDTDSMFVDPKIAPKLRDFFQPLNPYSFDALFFKIEKKKLWFYGISSKRYVLYDFKKDIIKIYDENNEIGYKLHGLGHITDPFNRKNIDWHKEIWEDILKLHYNQININDLIEKYSSLFAISNLTVSTRSVFERFKKFNENKPLNKQIKPANFFHIGMNSIGAKPISPKKSNPQSAPFEEFINYETGETLKGEEYWGTLDKTILDYINHPESKFNGDTGWLERKHIIINKIERIGKEINDLDKHILNIVLPQKYLTQKEKEELILEQSDEEAVKKGVGRSTFYEIKGKIKEGKKINWKNKSLLKLI
jgi:hypothetical protein